MKLEPSKRSCKFHGGKSTGPRTAEGKARIAQAQLLHWARWRSERSELRCRASP
ncbi:HGGxSTG domain-containing protein [Paracoccus marcusii]|uniref:HGGxSTG domain-containing protein n=1 Tax=Paracoccus marcusii TaxID=59779 RepID=UPI003263DA95